MVQSIGLSVSTEKIVHRGEKFRKILAFSCYEFKELPFKYLDDAPICVKENDKLKVAYSDGDWIEFKVGDLIPEKDFHRAIRTVKFCGHKLHLINQEIKEIKQNWSGVEDFVI